MEKIDKTQTYPKLTESRMVIRFQDSDPLGHLNNAKYFDYYFNAREDRVTQLYGLNLAKIFYDYKTAWVIYNHQISYLRPAVAGEWVRIFSRLVYFDADTIIVEFFMTDDEKKQLKNLLWTTMKYVNVETGRLVPHQDIVKDYLEVMLSPDVHADTTAMAERIKVLKTEIRHWIW